MADKVASLSLKELRALCKEAGVSSEDCIDKDSLRERAVEALERLSLPGAALGPVSKTLGLVATAVPSAGGGLTELLGDKLLTKEGEGGTAETLAGKKLVMLYFSAHWCPPCKAYTPELAQAYTASTKKDEVAIVFVSSDKDEASFNGYYAEMPFYALPFAARDEAAALKGKYDVKGIPSLVLLDGNGNTVNDNIRGAHAQYL
jgi:thiol-disulfide isomerase/thioredoxin